MEKLQQKIYSMSNSFLPLDKFYNDIQYTNLPHYNKDLAFNDLEKIADFIIELQQDNERLTKALDDFTEKIKNELYRVTFLIYDMRHYNYYSLHQLSIKLNEAIDKFANEYKSTLTNNAKKEV